MEDHYAPPNYKAWYAGGIGLAVLGMTALTLLDVLAPEVGVPFSVLYGFAL